MIGWIVNVIGWIVNVREWIDMVIYGCIMIWIRCR